MKFFYYFKIYLSLLLVLCTYFLAFSSKTMLTFVFLFLGLVNARLKGTLGAII